MKEVSLSIDPQKYSIAQEVDLYNTRWWQFWRPKHEKKKVRISFICKGDAEAFIYNVAIEDECKWTLLPSNDVVDLT